MTEDPPKLRTYRGTGDDKDGTDWRDDALVPDYVIGSAPLKETYWRGLKLAKKKRGEDHAAVR